MFVAASGKVISVTSSWKDNEFGKKSFGNLIVIQHSDGSKAYYGHLQARGVIETGLKVGDYVKRGDKIATSDNNGYSLGGHIHFEIRDKIGFIGNLFTSPASAALPTKPIGAGMGGGEESGKTTTVIKPTITKKPAPAKKPSPVTKPSSTPATSPAVLGEKIFGSGDIDSRAKAY